MKIYPYAPFELHIEWIILMSRHYVRPIRRRSAGNFSSSGRL
jgi:hypothetical protein